MPDMLVRLYALPDGSAYERRAGEAGIAVRRAEPWDRERLRAFVEAEFGRLWAVEADLAFRGWPITAYVAGRLMGRERR